MKVFNMVVNTFGSATVIITKFQKYSERRYNNSNIKFSPFWSWTASFKRSF